jgi:chitinase
MKEMVLLCAGAVMLALSARASGAPPADGRRVAGYFTEWNADFDVERIRADLLTHVIYAFATIKDGEIAISNPANAIEKVYLSDPKDASFHGRFGQLKLLKQKHPHLRTLISVGGWGGSAGFSDAALTDASRDRFARSCAAFVSKYGFDGIDIDWEFPVTGGHGGRDAGRPQDKRNFTLMLAQLRAHLDEQGPKDQKRYLLTFAAPAGAQQYRHIELDQVHKHVDWINLMTYDFAGTWSKVTCFNAPLFTPDLGIDGMSQGSCDATVRAYVEAGVPREKIVLGVPFFGQAFAGVKNVNNGLFQPHSGKPPEGAHDRTYRAIAASLWGEPAKRHWHDQAKVPWLYDAQTGVMVSYDDPESCRAKARYARDNNLGGVMIWELSQDDAEASLLAALNAGLSAK